MIEEVREGKGKIIEEMKAVGMVLGTEDATPLQFWFAVSEGVKVRLDDIVFVEVADPAEEGEMVRFFGVVDLVRRRLEGVQFDGDTELVAAGLLPAAVTYAAHVLVTRVGPEEFIPPGPGDRVFQARGEALDKALYLDNMDAPLPAGVLPSGDPGYLNFDFMNGQKGAHVNISGISGIATKTSYALFLLYSIFHADHRDTGEPLAGGGFTKAVVFNVKGEDLLFLDHPNADFTEAEERWRAAHRYSRSRYEICGLPPGPFDRCRMHAPAREAGRGQALLADVQSREGVIPFLWSLQAFAAERMLPFVLADGDTMSNLGFLVSHVEERLFKLATPQRGPHLEVRRFRHLVGEESGEEAFTPLEAESFMAPERRSELRGESERLLIFDDLVDFLEFKLLLENAADDEGRGGGDRAWTANQAKATREAFIRRLRGAAKHLRRLVRGDLPSRSFERARLDIMNSDSRLLVVDIHQLAPLGQMFTVGVLLREIFSLKETGMKGQLFVVLDELNKYAPAEGDSPIKDVLLDIAERGRSMGVILIGAQQTASEVERRVVGNSAIRVIGRLDAAEAERSEYRFLPASFRARSTILAPGTMIVHQPDVPTPLMLTFPFPSWATRKREVEELVDDDEALDILG